MCDDCSEREKRKGKIVAAATDLFEEHKAWSKNIGSTFAKALQGNYEEIDILAKNTELDFTSGEPCLKSEAIDKAEGA